MEKELQRLLCEGGISRRYCCHEYFTKCILRVVEQPSRLLNICRDVYLPVAQECHKDIRAIENGIRQARDLFISNGGAQKLAEMNGGDFWNNKTPYPSDIIEIFAFYLIELEENKKHHPSRCRNTSSGSRKQKIPAL